MKIGVKDETKVIVSVKIAHRDNREKVEGKPNPTYGKTVYETHDSIDVFDATAEEVFAAVNNGLRTAASKGK